MSDTIEVPRVVVRAAGGEEHVLYAGDLIGRGIRSALPLEDPRISEAHALLSLREGGFWLLALRGTVWTGARWGSEVAVTAGARLRLAEGVELEVVQVQLPATTLALEGLGPAPFVLQGTTLSLWGGSPVRVSVGFHGNADRWVWSSDGNWWARDRTGHTTSLEVGDEVEVGGQGLAVVGVPIDAAHAGETVRRAPDLPPLEIDIFDELTRIGSGGQVLVRLTGRSHDLFRWTWLLTQHDGPVRWEEVAERIWPANPSQEIFYRNRTRLSSKLRKAGLSGELLGLERGVVWVRVREGVDRVEVT